MAAVKACLLLCVLSVLSICAVDGAGHHHTTAAPAPAPSVDCSNLILNLADCLSFVSNGSTIPKPDKNCCTGFKTVLKAGPDCICQAFKNSGQLGVVIDVKRAMTLPAACGVHDSSAPTCGLSLAPASAPGPDTSPSMSGLEPTSAQEATPASAPAPKSSSSALSVSVVSLVLGLVAVAFSSF